MRRIAFVLCAMLASAAPAVAADPAGQARFDAAVSRTRALMMEDPEQALALARRAEAVAAAVPGARLRALAVARAQWLQGEAASRLDRNVEALPPLERALATVEQVAPADPLHGDILLSRGYVHEADGRVAAGLEDFQRSFTLYRAAGEARGEAKALQGIAGVYQDAGDLDRAGRYYTQAAEVYRADPALSLASYNDVGEILRSQGHYAAAEQQYRLALAAARRAGSPLLQAQVLANIATTRVLRGDVAGADRVAQEALALTGQRAAADERPFAWGVLAQIALARGNAAGAAALIGRTFAGVDLGASSLPYLPFHRLAADIYAHVGRDDLALAHMRAWKRLDDNVRAVAASTNAALMAARFDFSTQNLRIVQLQANRAKLHETILVVAVATVSVVSGLMLVGLMSLRRSRNQTREANRQLVKALKAKDDFLAMTSHEIRTPLNGILGMTQVLLADRTVAMPMRQRLEVVHGAGETMRALVDDILDLSKMETGKLEIEHAPVRLAVLIEEVARLWRGKAEGKQLRLDLDLAGCPALIEGDVVRLRQILSNLLSNAVKFTEAGGVTVRAMADGEQLRVEVADTGIGIAPDQHELIFEKFQQADGSMSRRFGGTGLGLAICRNLATAMAGSITVRSAPGQGATFTLTLPLRVPDCVEPEPDASAAAAPVLLLEPNALAQRLLARTLRDQGLEVEALASAAALIERLAGGPCERIVAQAAAVEDPAALAAAAERAGARLILLAAAEDSADLATRLPCAAVLSKPVTANVLLAALEAPLPLTAAA